MKPHKVEQMGLRRGDAKVLDFRLGLRTGGVTTRRYAQESETGEGRPSPAARAKWEQIRARARAYLAAAGAVNPDIPCNWVAEYFTDAEIQRAVLAGVERGEAQRTLAAVVAERSAELVKVLLSDATDEERDAAALRLMSAGARVRYTVMPEGDLPPVGEQALRRAA